MTITIYSLVWMKLTDVEQLALAVKAQALLFFRDVMGDKQVKTNHNALNEPMIAIDRKFGYVISPGNLYMRKRLT